jgi:hypothetical protein
VENLFSKLPFLKSNQAEGEAPEVDEAEAKKARIAFHREHVRNGPTNFKHVTGGQIKRAGKRDLARETKKARRRAVKQYLADQREGATIRGHLQAAGVLPYYTEDYRATPSQALHSVTWIIARFAPAPADGTGKVEVTSKVVLDSLTAALNRWQVIVGYPQTRLSPAYVLPVALPDDEAAEFARAVSQA